MMAHLKEQETKRNAGDRKTVELDLIRRLYESGYSRPEVVNLFRFIDWVTILPEGLKQAFWIELKAYEEERQTPYIRRRPEFQLLVFNPTIQEIMQWIPPIPGAAS